MPEYYQNRKMPGFAALYPTCHLTLVSGAGAAARNSIGLALVGGLFIDTLFTLFVVPSIYMLVARDHSKDRECESAWSTG